MRSIRDEKGDNEGDAKGKGKRKGKAEDDKVAKAKTSKAKSIEDIPYLW